MGGVLPMCAFCSVGAGSGCASSGRSPMAVTLDWASAALLMCRPLVVLAWVCLAWPASIPTSAA
eukprot:scaffold7523_cov132-Isochrysis_galbana.AAC.1